MDRRVGIISRRPPAGGSRGMIMYRRFPGRFSFLFFSYASLLSLSVGGRNSAAGKRDQMARILITGASGTIGTSLRKLLPPIYPDLLLSDLKPPVDLGAHEKFKPA